MPYSESLGLSEEFTLEAWVRPEGQAEGPILFTGAGGKVQFGMAIGFDQAGRPEGVIVEAR